MRLSYQNHGSATAQSPIRYTPPMEKSIKLIILKGEGGSSETIAAEEISENTFKVIENPVFNCRISFGTIVKVTENAEKEMVVSKVVRASDYKTKHFLLSSISNIAEFKIKIGNPIIEAGGFWELVMGGMLYVNLPRESTFNIDEIFRSNNLFPTEIVEK